MKRTKTKYGIMIGIPILTALLFLIFTETWIRTHDYYGLLKNTCGSLYVLKSLFPKNDTFAADGILLKLPYGFAKISSNSAISVLPLKNAAARIHKLNGAYTFVDQLGSGYIWRDETHRRLLFVNLKRSGKIYYLIFYTKPTA